MVDLQNAYSYLISLHKDTALELTERKRYVTIFQSKEIC